MTDHLLQTKLYRPPLRPFLVSRPRLFAQLDQGLQCGHKLTLVSAPAGFGKTTLVSEWAADCERPIAWLSLDEGDSDPTRFLAYLVAALQSIEANIVRGALSALQSPQPPPFESILTSLINGITVSPDKIVLILDDYHLIESSLVDDALTFLLEHLPPQMHLVIATRIDPNLPLARYRARGQLNELRAADLRFNSSEAAEFLTQVMSLNLSADDIAALETRTEGWIAGLQLAAVSMQGRKDVTEFIQSFTGSHHFVLDYLVEEVLEQQPESVQTFLLQTAVLDRLTGSLCDALTGQNNGQETLEMLEQANLFIVRLDEERHWYRYHRLFADLLRRRLRRFQAEQVTTLHRQAGTWYEDHGLASEALRHIFAVEDFQWAGRLVEQVGAVTIWKRGEWTNLLHWLEKFPNEVVHARPKLSLLSAWAMYFSGQPEAIEPFLRSVESHLQDAGDELVAGADRLTETSEATSAVSPLSKDLQSMMAEATGIRAFTSRWRGDFPRAIELFQRALELLPSKELHLRALLTGALAATHYRNGDIAAASPLIAEAHAIGWEGDNIYVASVITSRLAEMQVMQGHLHQAADIYRQMKQRFARRGQQYASVAGYACVGMGGILCEWNDLHAAVQQLREGIECGKQGANVRMLLPGYVAMARSLQALGDAAGARGAIREAMQVWQQYQMNRWWGVPPVAAYRARLCLAQGDVAAAAQWAQEKGLRTDGKLSYQREVDYLTLARLLIAQGNMSEAAGLLQRLLEAAEVSRRTLRVIETLILQALTFQAEGETNRALSALERALTLAEPGGFIRIFVEEGPSMVRLLDGALSHGIGPDHVRRLLAAFPIAEPEQAAPSKSQAPDSELIEPLSKRELEVLQLIAEGLTNQEIASRLYLSPNTVKVHTRNIYGKLDTHNRTQAVARAKASGILSPI